MIEIKCSKHTDTDGTALLVPETPFPANYAGIACDGATYTIYETAEELQAAQGLLNGQPHE